MRPFETLDSTMTAGGLRLELLRRGDDFYIHLDREELMSSVHTRSETELARLAIGARQKHQSSDAGASKRPMRVLVGGLGMGFTLRAALDATAGLTPRGEVTVAEIFDKVVDWNRRWLGTFADKPLDDPRTHLAQADVADVIAASDRQPFDVILLDVDNGPNAMCLPTNRRLYDPPGLARIHAALAPGGILGIWSAGEEPRFKRRLEKRGFTVSCHRPHTDGRGRRHFVYLAVPKSTGPTTAPRAKGRGPRKPTRGRRR